MGAVGAKSTRRLLKAAGVVPLVSHFEPHPTFYVFFCYSTVPAGRGAHITVLYLFHLLSSKL